MITNDITLIRKFERAQPHEGGVYRVLLIWHHGNSTPIAYLKDEEEDKWELAIWDVWTFLEVNEKLFHEEVAPTKDELWIDFL